MSAIIHKLRYLVKRGTCWTILEPIENVMKSCTKQIYWYYPCLRGTIWYVIDRCTEWFLIHVFYWRWHLTFHIVILCWALFFVVDIIFLLLFSLLCVVDSGLEMVHEKTFSLPSKWIDAVWHLNISLWELFNIDLNKQNQKYR